MPRMEGRAARAASFREVDMAVTTPTDELGFMRPDDVLRLIALIRATKPRDPLRAMEDAMLDLRLRLAADVATLG